MVLFLHNTSRCSDEPYPTLLRDKGFSGFPSLAFMNADGDVVATVPYSRRDVASFEAMATALEQLAALTAAEAEAGGEPDPELRKKLLLCRAELGSIEPAEGWQQFAQLQAAMSADEASRCREQLAEAELMEIGTLRLRGKELAARLEAMVVAQHVPQGAMAVSFWVQFGNVAGDIDSVDSLQAAKEQLGVLVGSNRNLQRSLDRVEKVLQQRRGK